MATESTGQGYASGFTQGNASSAKALIPAGGFPLFLCMLLLSVLIFLVMGDSGVLSHFIIFSGCGEVSGGDNTLCLMTF